MIENESKDKHVTLVFNMIMLLRGKLDSLKKKKI